MDDKEKYIEMQAKKIAEQASLISALEQEIELLKEENYILNLRKN